MMTRDAFFVGGEYAGPASARVMHGQMYVEVLTPERVTKPFPLVFIHGTGQTAANWGATPDGRMGWAEWFVGQGWRVCVVDQPLRGRSAWQPVLDGPLSSISVPHIERLFTACSEYDDWPQAKLHTQWPGGPGKGHPGDPAFDQFYASQVGYPGREESEMLGRAAGAALLDRIGEAVLVVHSQAGALGWLIADARPDRVKALVALEPWGPPYKDEGVVPTGAEKPWGLTLTPLTYDPRPSANDPLRFIRQAEPPEPGLQQGWLQAEPARRLAHLTGVPVLLVTGEASYHVPYDHCTVSYLRQAGVEVEHMRLLEHGVRGNGHMLMLELNNTEVAALVAGWLDRQFVPAPAHPPIGSTPV